MVGLLEAFRGRRIDGLPPALAKALDDYQASLGKSRPGPGPAAGQGRGDRGGAQGRRRRERPTKPTRLAYVEILGQIEPAQGGRRRC